MRRMCLHCALLAMAVAAASFAQEVPGRPSGGNAAASASLGAPPAAPATRTPQSAAPAALQPDVPLELRPYRVQVLLGFEADPGLTPEVRAEILAQTAATAARVIGPMWTLQIEESRRVLPASSLGLSRLEAEPLVSAFDESTLDKAYFVCVESIGCRFAVAGREWEPRARDLGAIATAETYQLRRVPETIVTVLCRLFRPVLAIHAVDLEAGTAELRAQAGHFPPGDPESIGLKEGDVIVPFFRYFDRKRVLRQIQAVPLTYLLVDGLERARVDTTVVTGLRMALGGARRRVEQLALAVHPGAEGTLVQFVPRGNRDRPLVAHQVRIEPKTLAEEEPVAEPLLQLTDRRGRVRIPLLPGQSVVWLYVQSGSLLLARVPFVPGLKPADVIELPDDTLRLQVEGDIELLQQRLIDTIAKRSAYMARAKAAARAGQHSAADAEMAALTKLPGMSEFENQLNAIRVPALERAQAARDRSSESKIRKMCETADKMIRQYLDEEPVRVLREELQEIRRLDAEDRAGM